MSLAPVTTVGALLEYENAFDDGSSASAKSLSDLLTAHSS
jgi:hypothetical protein